MATIKIIPKNEKAQKVIRRQYETQKASKFLMLAFKTAGLKLLLIDGVLTYDKKGGIREENLPQITGFLGSEGLKEGKDYALEVLK